VENIVVVEDLLTPVDFEVGAPHYIRSQTSINLIVYNHLQGTGEFYIENSGSGDLYFDIEPETVAPPNAWLSVSPPSGIVPPNETFAVTINVLADTTDNGAFDFFGELHVATNSCPGTTDTVLVIASVLDVENAPAGIPSEFALYPAYPNPFNASTALRFDVPYDIHLNLEIFDINGRSLFVPASGFYTAGSHTVTLNFSGQASGLYVARLTAHGAALSRKLILLK
jgi:hypothetical protein